MRWTLDGPGPEPLSAARVARHLGVSLRKLYEMIEAGEFPRGRPIHSRRVVWTGLDVAAHLYLLGRYASGALPPVEKKNAEAEG